MMFNSHLARGLSTALRSKLIRDRKLPFQEANFQSFMEGKVFQSFMEEKEIVTVVEYAIMLA
jgi:hypothetical protein